MKRFTMRVAGCVALVLAMVVSSGCPLLENTEHGVQFMYSMTDNAGSAIETLEVTIDRVSLLQAGEETIIYDQPFVVDMRTTISTPVTLGFSLVTPDSYTSIKLRVSAVKLVFASDPGTEHTEVILTNGNPITLTGLIPLEGTLQSIIHVQFNSLDVLEAGPEITMAPQALVTQQPVNAQAAGSMGTVFSHRDEFYLPVVNGNLHVNYTDADIYLPGDTNGNPTGDESDLASGRTVRVSGSFQPWGDVVATRVTLY